PACGRKTQAPDELIGKRARCPLCQQVITVPQPSGAADQPPPDEPAPRPSSRPPDDDADRRRPCPMCGEPIREDATRCRFCGEEFDGGGRRDRPRYRRRDPSTAATTSLVCGIIG